MKFKIKYIIFILFIIGCGKKENQNIPLVKIFDKSISVEEFITRSEYAIRPNFCQNNSLEEKKIILKNLILEKLISQKIISDENLLSENQKNYVTGRIHQAMRQVLYSKVAEDSIQIDPMLIHNNYQVLGRVYDLSFIQMPTSYNKIENVLNSWDSDSTLKIEYPKITIFPKKLKWNEHEQKEILDSLFIPNIIKNQIIGPFYIGKFSMFIKVNGWIDNPALTENEINYRKQRLTDFYKKYDGEDIYLNFIKSLMKDKNLYFKKESFGSFVNLIGSKMKMNNEQIINIKSSENQLVSMFENNLEIDNEDVIFQIGDEFWTTEKLLDFIKVHPLVFRKTKMKKSEFPRQLKLAIGDLIRDYNLTNEAINLGLDNDDIVIQQQHIWTEYFTTQNFLKEKFPVAKSSDEWLDNNIFQTEMDSLINTEENNINVNWDELEKVNLTQIPFHAIYPKEPYPNVTAEILPITKSQLNIIIKD